MNWFLPRLTMILIVAGVSSARFSKAAEPEGLTNGQLLAAALRSLEPAEESEVTGVLRVKRGRGHPVEEIPFSCKVSLRTNGWDTTYRTSATGTNGAQELVIRHFTNAPSVFLFASGSNASAALAAPREISIEQIGQSLAGTDFSLSELGLDFLFWPEQKRLRGEMRLGEPCYVLESRNASGMRIKSWIDKSSFDEGIPGLLVAEAYDERNELVKEFSLGGGSFKKVHGRWVLEQMKIRSVGRGSETILKFNLPTEK